MLTKIKLWFYEGRLSQLIVEEINAEARLQALRNLMQATANKIRAIERAERV